MVMDSVYGSDLSQTIEITPHSLVTSRSPPPTMPVVPPPFFSPFVQTPLPPAPGLQSFSGDKETSREQITCLLCKEYSIGCHGPEVKLDGHCSNCHEKGKKCEFESRASDPNLIAPSSSLNSQPSAIDDGTPHPTPSKNNDNRTDIVIPNPQPDTPSSPRQSYQKNPIIDESRDRETSNTIDGITNDESTSGEPRIKPWWKRLFSWNNRREKRKRRS